MRSTVILTWLIVYIHRMSILRLLIHEGLDKVCMTSDMAKESWISQNKLWKMPFFFYWWNLLLDKFLHVYSDSVYSSLSPWSSALIPSGPFPISMPCFVLCSRDFNQDSLCAHWFGGFGLCTGAWWVHCYTTEDENHSSPGILHQEGWVLMSSTQLQDWLLVGPILGRPSAANYSYYEIIVATVLSCPRNISHLSSFSFGSYIIFTPSSAVLSES